MFRRTRRVDVGSYKAPEERELPPIEHVVEDGMLIAISAVRMAVKNRLIVDALREDRAFDAEALAEVARDELLELARQNDDSTARVWADGSWDDEPSDSERNQRKREVLTGLAAALRAEAADAERLAILVDDAKTAAWQEVGGVLAARIQPEETFVRDATYESEREGRIRALKEVDLAGLETFWKYRDLLN